MTHPDILRTEKYGELKPEPKPITKGKCIECHYPIYDDDDCFRTPDGLVCYSCDLDYMRRFFEKGRE